MFSHVVIFWTKPEVPGAADKLFAGAQQYLAAVPGVRSFHAGRMVPSARPVVEQSYQVAINIIFDGPPGQVPAIAANNSLVRAYTSAGAGILTYWYIDAPA